MDVPIRVNGPTRPSRLMKSIVGYINRSIMTMLSAYLIMAARAVGLDIGAMSGFDRAMVDAAYFAGSSVESNFLCNLGYGVPSNLPPRRRRFDFDEACRIV